MADEPECPEIIYRIIDLHDISSPNHSYAHGINNRGEVVGEMGFDPLSNAGSFVWLLRLNYGIPERTMFNLENQPIGGPSGVSVARDINSHGMVIGYHVTPSASNAVTVWGVQNVLCPSCPGPDPFAD